MDNEKSFLFMNDGNHLLLSDASGSPGGDITSKFRTNMQPLYRTNIKPMYGTNNKPMYGTKINK